MRENPEVYEKYKEKDRLRKQGKPRQTQKTRSIQDAKIVKEKERIRKRIYRQKLKQGNLMQLKLATLLPNLKEKP